MLFYLRVNFIILSFSIFRLEFLGDAVVEFLTTIHLFFLFTELDEGGLATFRSALVFFLF